MSEALSVAFVRDHAFGTLAGVHLPGRPDPLPEEALARLHEAEARVARGLAGFRQAEWAGGRLAWAAAAERRGLARAPLLADRDRVPLAPEGLSVSVTHKRDLAVVVVGDAARGHLGIDLESLAASSRPSVDVAPRVLRPEERAEVDALPEPARTEAVLLRFSIKEATYKAIFPRLRRYVAYSEARVVMEAAGPRVELEPAGGERLPALEVACERVGDRVLSLVRCPRG